MFWRESGSRTLFKENGAGITTKSLFPAPCSLPLPRPFNAKGTQPFGFAVGQVVLEEAVHAAAARAAAQAGAQLGQVGLGAMRNHLHVAVFGVAYPAAQVEFTGFPIHLPPETNPLHAPFNQKMKDHR